ncbi:hydantoinase/oxoprolinase family protein [Paraburkholderia sp.]|uniref:hydantoinase/oxoprolinase family protein n=1 Tax=Paraburkholderia sp. TaxID=1926495 RepID=UPI003C7A4B1C
MPNFSLAVDIGGTFTDFVLLDEDRKTIHTEKVLSSPSRSEIAIFEGIQKLSRNMGMKLSDVRKFLHATTIITNAVIERKGADAILLHTSGFRDILEIGREHRYSLTNLKLRFPDPVISQALRIPVEERVNAHGIIATDPDKRAVQKAVREIVQRTGIKNFAICFLHAHKNQGNELLAREWILELYPDAYVCCSGVVAPTEREYERWTTCSVNAYTMPLLSVYIKRVTDNLKADGFHGKSLIMTSSGFPMEFDRCVQYPIRMIESGPAAGVLAAKEIAARNSQGADIEGQAGAYTNALAYDMGGTTAKGAFLTNGAFSVQNSLEVARVGAFEPGSGLPLLIPAIDLIEIGVGGGSIAALDSRGVVGVGPKSAGADPGPACYGRGGEAPTVTDANVALGYLSKENFGNSGITIKPELAIKAIEKTIAEPLGLSFIRAARGIRDTVSENVSRAFRVHASELGIDYRRYSLICTGGSAPLHAAEIARKLAISTVIFPFSAGVSSAFGLFASREGITLQRTSTVPLSALTAERVSLEVQTLIKSDQYASSLVDAGASTGLRLGMRYIGQGYEVTVSLGTALETDVDVIKAAFVQEYRQVFGIIFPEHEIEVFSWTIDIAARNRLTDLRGFRYANAGSGGNKVKENRTIFGGGAPVKVPVYNRYALEPGDVIEGSALIEEHDTTINIPTFARATVQPNFDIVAHINTSRMEDSDHADR